MAKRKIVEMLNKTVILRFGANKEIKIPSWVLMYLIPLLIIGAVVYKSDWTAFGCHKDDADFPWQSKPK